MKLVEILSPQMVMSELDATDKEGAIRQMCTHIAKHKTGLKVDDMVRTLLEREKLGSTGIGEGVAIPHGKLNGIDNDRVDDTADGLELKLLDGEAGFER